MPRSKCWWAAGWYAAPTAGWRRRSTRACAPSDRRSPGGWCASRRSSVPRCWPSTRSGPRRRRTSARGASWVRRSRAESSRWREGAMADVRFERATRVYPGTDAPAVDALEVEIASGELMVLVGPSGSGKSTALRMLAGLEEVDDGFVWIDGRDVTDEPPKARDV